MANKKISELAVRTPSLSDLMLVGDPSTGYSYKATISSLSTLLEANIALDDLNDVTITSPTAGQVLSYNGTAWVNDTNGITGTGTPNYIAKFTGSSSIGNTVLYEDGFSLGLGTTAPSPIATGFRSVTINGTNRAYVTLQVTGVDLGYFYAVPSSRVELSSQTALPLVFSTNATERMRLDASGNLGLGTSSPARKLDVNGTMRIADGSSIEWGGVTTGISGSSNTLLFYTNSAERMRLDASGNLGLGTTTFPTFSNTTQLVVRGGTGPSIIQSVSNDKGSSITLYSGNNSSDNPVVIYQKDLRFASVTDDGLTGYSERMRITSGGELLINTTSDLGDYKLQINGNARVGTSTGSSFNITTNQAAGTSGSPLFTDLNFLGYADNVEARIRSWDESANTNNGTLTFWTNNSGTAAEKMRITSGGNVGIGTTSPLSLLHINGSSSGAVQSYIQNSNGGTNSSAELVFGTWSGAIPTGSGNPGPSAKIVALNTNSNNAATDLIFHTYAASGTSAERMRITSGGDVGIGTSSPASKLDVNAAISGAYTTSSSQAVARLYNITNAGGINSSVISFQASTDDGSSNPIARIGVVGESAGSNNGAMIMMTRDGSGVTERMRITSGGNVGIGTSSPAVKLDVNGDVNLASGYTLSWGGAYGANIPSIAGVSGVGSNIRFYPSGSTTGETMRITSGGNVGIGTTTPGSKLSIVGLPTSSTGLSAGDVWNDSGTLKIV